MVGLRRLARRITTAAADCEPAMAYAGRWAPSSWPATSQIRTVLRSRGVVHLSGPDAGVFLQGLVSNDILGGPVYTGFFNHKGRYLFDAFVMRGASGSYLLDVESSVVDDAIAHMSRYRLRSKVKIENRSDSYQVESFLSGSPRPLSQIMDRVRQSAIDDSFGFFDPRLPSLGLRTVFPKDHALEGDELFADVDEEDNLFNAWMMLNGIPRHRLELSPGKTIPLEANLDFLNGIAFSKGCYLGQELIARTHFTGLIRKRTVPVFLSSMENVPVVNPLFATAAFDPLWSRDPLQPGEAILSDGNAVGKITSNMGNIGLATLRLEHVFRPSAPFVCNGIRVHPVIPSWFINK
uniref:Uncharacterized protein n=1 Tax=Spongospora subterranea TaxID=70186 RepID=A0A0H5QHH7_9EUKA|eukprot:CRZ01475.1 hypothetical protein [Spongospora subterranea]